MGLWFCWGGGRCGLRVQYYPFTSKLPGLNLPKIYGPPTCDLCSCFFPFLSHLPSAFLQSQEHLSVHQALRTWPAFSHLSLFVRGVCPAWLSPFWKRPSLTTLLNYPSAPGHSSSSHFIFFTFIPFYQLIHSTNNY